MPRLARKIASSGFYHVIVRGNGKQILFESDSDRVYFLTLLERYGEKYGIKYHAWCLMDNHVHFLIQDPLGNLRKAMHDVNCVYAQYFNNTYEHVGSVFQGRYKSIPIEQDHYLLAVMRYIHRNPIKAGLSNGLAYPWSSYKDYLYGSSFTYTEMVLEMLGGIDGFLKYCSEDDTAEYCRIKSSEKDRVSDSQAIEMAKILLGDQKYLTIKNLGKIERDECLLALINAGLSVRQLERITGVGRGIIRHLFDKVALNNGRQTTQSDTSPMGENNPK